jgi:hypothetical protein
LITSAGSLIDVDGDVVVVVVVVDDVDRDGDVEVDATGLRSGFLAVASDGGRRGRRGYRARSGRPQRFRFRFRFRPVVGTVVAVDIKFDPV